MQAGATIVVIGIVLAITIGVLFLPALISLFVNGFGSFLTDGFNNIDILFGTRLSYIFSTFIVVILLVLFFRFLISRLGEDSGHSANS